MNLKKERNKKILKMRSENLTLREIGEKFSITRERVRQILLPKIPLKTCSVHKKSYSTEKCYYCVLNKNYLKVLDILIKNGYTPGLIITPPDKPKGRKMILTPPPVKVFLPLGLSGAVIIKPGV